MDFVDYATDEGTAFLSFERYGARHAVGVVHRDARSSAGELNVYPAPPAAPRSSRCRCTSSPVTPTDVRTRGCASPSMRPAPTPLATLRLEHPHGGTLRLGVLGASHVVTVEDAEIAASPNRSRAPRTARR